VIPARCALTAPLLLALACKSPEEETGSVASAEPPFEELSASLHETQQSVVVADWQQLEPGSAWVEFSADGQAWLTSPVQQVEAGPQQALLLGMPYGVEVQYRLVSDAGQGEVSSELAFIETGEQPADVPDLDLLGADESQWDPHTHYVLGSIDEQDDNGVGVATWVFIFDRQGRVVWAWRTPTGFATIHSRVAQGGTDFLIDCNSYYAIYDQGAASQVVRLKIDGTELARYDTPGLHHPFTDMADGSIVWAATQSYWDTLKRLHPDGTEESIWSCADFYGDLEHSAFYCASNTITWDEASDRFLFSLYSSESVVEIDPESGQSLRWFGHLPQAWGFDPEDSAFWWQHGVHYTEQGTLLVSAKEEENGDETVVREYELDEDSQTLVQIWSFGDGEGVYGPEMGEAHRLGNGNTLHNYGSGARVREITPAGEVVWDLSFSSGTYLGRTTPIEDLYAFAP